MPQGRDGTAIARGLDVMSAASHAADPPSRGDHLAGNLERLRAALPELVEAIRATGSEGAELVEGPRGQVTVAWRGSLVSSAYDPQGEGERFARAVPETADVVVAIGVGSGHHLETLCGHPRARVVLYEPRLPLLRAVLSAARWSWTGASELDVVADPEALAAVVGSLYRPGLGLHLLVHPSFARTEPDALREAVERIGRAKDRVDIGFATICTWSEHWARTTLRNVPQIVASAPLGPLRGALEGCTAVVCAAGPSLAMQLPRLRENRERLLVLAIGQSAVALEKAGLTPHLTMVTETQDVSHQLEALEDLSQTRLVLVPQVHPRLFELPVRARHVVYECFQPLACWLGAALGEEQWMRSGGTVAISTVFLAALLGARRVLLVGQDLAFTDGRRYSEGSLYGEMGVEQGEDGQVFFTNQKVKADYFHRYAPERELAPNTVWVEGWDGKPVLTDRSYATFREEYAHVGRLLAKEGVELVNCTEGGARIPGLPHRRLAEELARVEPPVVGADAILEHCEPPEPERAAAGLARALAELEGRLRKIRRHAPRGLERCRAARARGRYEEEELRAIAAAEQKVREVWAETPVLSVTVQAEIQRLVLDSHKDRERELASLVERSQRLLEAALRGVETMDEMLQPLRDYLRKPSTGPPGSEPGRGPLRGSRE